MTKKQQATFDEALKAFDDGVEKLDRVLDVLLAEPDEPDFDDEEDGLDFENELNALH